MILPFVWACLHVKTVSKNQLFTGLAELRIIECVCMHLCAALGVPRRNWQECFYVLALLLEHRHLSEHEAHHQFINRHLFLITQA